MRPRCDDTADMGHDRKHQRLLDERSVEALLLGRMEAVPDELLPLAGALQRLRSSTGDPQPSAELLRVFAHGVGGEAVDTAPAYTEMSRSEPNPIEKGRTIMRTFIARAAGLSLAAKLGLGTAVAAAAVGAGAAGGLGGDGEVPAAEQAEFGHEVAETAVEEGGVDGEEVAAEARQRGEEQRDGWQSQTAREHVQQDREDRRDNASETGQQASDAGSDNASETGQRARERGAENGLDTARENTDERARVPESVPQSGEEGRQHAEERVGQTPAQEAPAGPETGDQHRSGTAGEVPPQDGRSFGQQQAEDRAPETTGRR
jgi:hypothetical protein